MLLPFRLLYLFSTHFVHGWGRPHPLRSLSFCTNTKHTYRCLGDDAVMKVIYQIVIWLSRKLLYSVLSCRQNRAAHEARIRALNIKVAENHLYFRCTGENQQQGAPKGGMRLDAYPDRIYE